MLSLWYLVSCLSHSNRKDPMPANDSGTVSIPAIGLTFTPVVQPEPVLPKYRPITSFPLGSQVVENNYSGVYTVVEDRTDGRGVVRVMKDNKVYEVFHPYWLLESETELTCDGCRREPKPIPAVPTPLVPFSSLPHNAVFICPDSDHLMRAKVDNGSIWWNKQCKSCLHDHPVRPNTLCQLVGYLNQ